jgi:cell wall-associated NlpC family hydrolase
MRPASKIVERARAIVGVPFRPQGRESGTGFDCVGVILHACGIPADEIRRDYRLRGQHHQEIANELSIRFRPVCPGHRRVGDVLLCAIGRDQVHLAIDCGGSFVHADARLRKVVETPGQPAWPIIAAFRGRRP